MEIILIKYPIFWRFSADFPRLRAVKVLNNISYNVLTWKNFSEGIFKN